MQLHKPVRDYICGFIDNSSVLFPNLLELFFWPLGPIIRKALYEDPEGAVWNKKLFQNKIFLSKIFKLLLLFFNVFIKRITKKICPNLFKLGSKWSRWHGLQSNRELFSIWGIKFFFKFRYCNFEQTYIC